MKSRLSAEARVNLDVAGPHVFCSHVWGARQPRGKDFVMMAVTHHPHPRIISARLLSALAMILITVLCHVDLAAQTTGAVENSSSPSQCKVRVIANDLIVSDKERVAVGYHVLPPGIIPDPGAWPFFAWSDTSLGVVRNHDGSDYLFFGSDGGCHMNCSGTDQRWGSITRSEGTFDHPLGEPLGDPNPPVVEFDLPTSQNLPLWVSYAGGGPVYRVPDGEPGAGSLLMVYHIERIANPIWGWSGLAKSTDEGMTWQDLGLFLTVPHPYNPTGASDVGQNPLVPYIDPVTHEKYFYIFFPQHCWTSTAECSDFTYVSVARAPYEKLLVAALLGSKSIPNLFQKYYNGKWDQPSLGGLASETFPGVTGYTAGDFQIVWSAYRQHFIAMMDNSQYIAYGESADGLHWPPMQVIYAEPNLQATVAYANAVGLEDDPGVLGQTFYSYYTEFPVPNSPWQPATLNRLTITTAPGLKDISPSSATAGGSGFTLTVNGEHFAQDSTVLWDGSPRATTYVSANQLTAQILASDIADAGHANVKVSSPAPCGGDSDARRFTISPQ